MTPAYDGTGCTAESTITELKAAFGTADPPECCGRTMVRSWFPERCNGSRRQSVLSHTRAVAPRDNGYSYRSPAESAGSVLTATTGTVYSEARAVVGDS